MNDKIRIWEGKMSDKTPGRGGLRSGRSGNNALVTISASREGTCKTNKSRDVMRVSFHRRMMELTGWKKGDVLDMEISGQSATVYRGDRGVQLCEGSRHTGRLYIRFSLPAGSLNDFPFGECLEVETKPGRIAFLLPKVDA